MYYSSIFYILDLSRSGFFYEFRHLNINENTFYTSYILINTASTVCSVLCTYLPYARHYCPLSYYRPQAIKHYVKNKFCNNSRSRTTSRFEDRGSKEKKPFLLKIYFIQICSKMHGFWATSKNFIEQMDSCLL